MVPEAFVIDAQNRLRYHGRIDDQFATRGVRNANPAGNELKEAIAAVLKRAEVKTPYAAVVGCPLPEQKTSSTAPTYSKEVARILQQNCLECHRKGQVGPFVLDSYPQARKRAEDIAAVAEDRSMPPWKAARGIGGRFLHDRSLAEGDIATLSAWAEAGAPEGNPADLPLPRTFSDDWTLDGGPDLVLDIGTNFPIPAGGPDIYRCFVVPTSLPSDVYISGIEYRPGNRGVVHHVLAYVDASGNARKKDAADPGPGYSCFSGPGVEIHGDLGGWAPGNQPTQLADGIGRALPKNADVIIQVHYHPSGKPELDRTRIGLRFSRKPIRQVVHWNAAVNFDMKLKAGESNIEIQAAWPVPVDLIAHAVVPHMHLLGKDMLMSVRFPNGKVQDLIKINEWDFNWQYTYYFEHPLELPKGSVVQVVAHYDNSAGNPKNPNNPPRDVAWGEATTDEMCIGFIGVTKKGQDLTRPGEKDDLMEYSGPRPTTIVASVMRRQESGAGGEDSGLMSELCIVTGGAGFIGSHLVKLLVDSGRRVRVVERPGADVKHLAPEVEVVFADIRDRAAIAAAVQGGTWVYHLAANPNLWARDRRQFEEVNHRGTVNVLEAARCGCTPRAAHQHREHSHTLRRLGPD